MDRRVICVSSSAGASPLAARAWLSDDIARLPIARVASMSVHLVALEFDAHDPERLAAFWAPILGRRIDTSGRALPGVATTDFEIRFVPESAAKTAVRHRMHLDLTSTSPQDQTATVDTAIRLGGRHVDVGQRGDEGHVVLGDPEDNEFCVVESDNRFLENTARIGAIAGEGMPRTGHFWSRVLGWPLVWDQDEETAIQSPDGGAKITWGGPPVPAKTARNRLRWVVEARGAHDVERAHLVGLGACVLAERSDGTELADPEGNEFVLA